MIFLASISFFENIRSSLNRKVWSSKEYPFSISFPNHISLKLPASVPSTRSVIFLLSILSFVVKMTVCMADCFFSAPLTEIIAVVLRLLLSFRRIWVSLAECASLPFAANIANKVINNLVSFFVRYYPFIKPNTFQHCAPIFILLSLVTSNKKLNVLSKTSFTKMIEILWRHWRSRVCSKTFCYSLKLKVILQMPKFFLLSVRVKSLLPSNFSFVWQNKTLLLWNRCKFHWKCEIFLNVVFFMCWVCTCSTCF